MGELKCYNEAPEVSSSVEAFSYGLSNCDNDFFEGQGVLPLDYVFYDSLGAELESAQYTVSKSGLYYMTVQVSIGWVSLYSVRCENGQPTFRMFESK